MKIRLKISFPLLVCVFLFSQTVFSQNSDNKKEGSVTINADNRLDSLVQIQKKINEEKQTMPGYRVQVYFGPDRKKANEIKSGFLQKHQDVSAYMIYQQPNYKVRIGDYRTRLEAYKLSQQLLSEYPAAFIVKDEIALPPME